MEIKFKFVLTIVLCMNVIFSNAQSTSQRILNRLDGNISYESSRESFSPIYSDIGMGIKKKFPGIESLYLHYNRKTTTIKSILTYEGSVIQTANRILSIQQETKQGNIQYAFYDRNSIIVSANNIQNITISMDSVKEAFEKRMTNLGNIVTFQCYLPNIDKRSTDKYFPFILSVKIINGQYKVDEDKHLLSIMPDKNNKTYFAISANMLEIDPGHIADLLNDAPLSIKEAEKLTLSWMDNAIGEFSFGNASGKEEKVLANAVMSLLFNLTKAPGFLSGYISQFPSRGGYPCHYLWDACFQNLAYDYMDPQLSKDALLLLLKNMRVDGKISSFMCSTWLRPHESQPPLIGWAALRLIKQRNDTVFAREILPLLIKNNEWWLTQRMTSAGLIFAESPLETGWDDTPRFDEGAVISTDMNSYLLLQIGACKEIAEMLGETEIYNEMSVLEKEFADKIMEVLYDDEDGIFYDVHRASREYVKMITPANFIPLLANVPISEKEANNMIENYLLNPEKMFGDFPFPSVAYDEPKYDADDWWRGPIWIAAAYLSMEVLQKYGYTEEYKTGATRIYNMIIDDERISELFDSSSGEGLGNAQQGWTAAILLKLKMELMQ